MNKEHNKRQIIGIREIDLLQIGKTSRDGRRGGRGGKGMKKEFRWIAYVYQFHTRNTNIMYCNTHS